MAERIQLAVVGGGPAGLRAAEVAAGAGVKVVLFDAKPSVGRKFLVAGKGGLNLTNGEEAARFAARYSGPGQPDGFWEHLIGSCDAEVMRAWAAGMGVETFQAKNGRIYPREMKAAPLLRRWIARLRDMGVRFEMNHRWTGIIPGAPHVLEFSNDTVLETDAVVFALGGASWPQTGSDGSWVRVFRENSIACHDLQPANCGWRHPWTLAVLAAAEGKPMKNITASAGGVSVDGELLLTRYGLEGGAVYQLGSVLGKMERPALTIDFKPTFTVAQLLAKMESVRGGFLAEARTRWRLGDAAHAILARREWHDAASLAHEAKHCVIPLDGPQPIEEAISSAGGVCWEELDASLMVRRFPGIFVAGEMVDWEAPTGGYLIQGSFATGGHAGKAAAGFVRSA